MPERFNNGVDDAMLDLITSDEMSTYESIPREIKNEQPTKPKKRKTHTPPPAMGIDNKYITPFKRSLLGTYFTVNTPIKIP